APTAVRPTARSSCAQAARVLTPSGIIPNAASTASVLAVESKRLIALRRRPARGRAGPFAGGHLWWGWWGSEEEEYWRPNWARLDDWAATYRRLVPLYERPSRAALAPRRRLQHHQDTC